MNIPHIEQLPRGWEAAKLKRVVTLRTERGTKGSPSENYVGLENIQSWTGQLIRSQSIINLADEKETDSIVSCFEPGDVLFGKLRPYLAKAHLAQEPGICTTELIVMKPSDQLDGRFLLHVLLTPEVINRVDAESFGAKMPRADWDTIGDLSISLPTLSEQQGIADYLDRETAEIDALIDTNERLLDLAIEKRRTLISHVVTRGLDPDAPMQDSGDQLLGEVPTHWDVTRLKMLGHVRSGVAKGRNLNNRETVSLPYLRVANVQDGYFDLSDIAMIEVLPEEVSAFTLKTGDVLMNEGGDADKLGRGAVWDGSIDPCLHQNHVFAVRCFGVEPAWLATVTRSDYAKAYFESRSKQSTNLASISATNIQELPVTMPPHQERQVIMEHTEQAMSELNNLMVVTEQTIELLRERRASMITAAVTGQIPVMA